MGKKSVIISFAFLLLAACSSSDSKNSSKFAPDVSINDGESLNPSEAGPIVSGDEGCVSSDSIAITPSEIDFKLNQINTSDSPTRECQTISVNGCQEFEVEIANSSTSGTGSNRQPEFVLENQGAVATGRIPLTSGVTKVCFQRVSPGDKTGRVQIVSRSGRFAGVIPLRGTSISPIFTVDYPTKNLLVWEKDFGNPQPDASADQNRPYPYYFGLTAVGRVNLGAAAGLVRKNEVTISVKNGGTTVKQTLDPNGSFSKDIEIPTFLAQGTNPYVPAKLHPIHFSVPIQKGDVTGTITKIVPVIRFAAPTGRVILRNANGNNIRTVAENAVINDRRITVGVLIDNLEASGPDSTHPVTLSMKLAQSEADLGRSVSIGEQNQVDLHYRDLGENPSLPACYGKFNQTGEEAAKIHCFDVNASDLNKGINVFKVSACNEYTREGHRQNAQKPECVELKTTIIVDNDKPIITFNTPNENSFFPDLNGNVEITGTIENFRERVTVTNQDGTRTEKCGSELWVNESFQQAAIPLCDNNITIRRGMSGNLQSGNSGNIRMAEFRVTLTPSGIEGRNALTQFTNVVRVAAQNNSKHLSVAVLTFQRGTSRKGDTFNSTNRTLTSGSMGANAMSNGRVIGSPVTAHISEGLLKNDQVIDTVRKILNDNLKFKDLAMGGKPKEDANGRIKIGTGTSTAETMPNILSMLHGGLAPEQVRALFDYRRRQPGATSRTFFPVNEAVDQCGNPITTAIITPKMYQYIYPGVPAADLDDIIPAWPRPASGICTVNGAANGAIDPDCDTVTEGSWDIFIDLKDNGFIDVVLSLDGKMGKINGVDRKLPAFWGHFMAYNLVNQGTTGAYQPLPGLADPLIPVMMNVGRLELRLTDMLRVVKAQRANANAGDLNPMGIETRINPTTNEEEPVLCHSANNCTNMIYVYQDRVQNSNSFATFEPYENCAELFQARFPHANMPFGCNTANGRTYPFLIDTNSPQGAALFNASGRGQSETLLTLTRDVFGYTFKNIVSCIGTQVVNPILDSTTFPYPKWVAEKDKFTDLALVVDQEDGEVAFKVQKSANDPEIVNPAFNLKPKLKDADIDVKNGGITLRLPATLGASGIPNGARPGGYSYRAPTTAFDTRNGIPAEQVEQPFLGVSIGIEEIFNAATNVLMKKGVKSLLDLFGIDKLTPPPGHDQGGLAEWTIGLDQVIFGRFDICDISNGLLSTNLPTGTLMSRVQELFGDAPGSSHWDVVLDPNQPPTLALLPPDSLRRNGTDRILQVGISNIQIKLYSWSETSPGRYEIGDEKIIHLRLDGILRLGANYNRSTRTLSLAVLPLDQQALYLSVIDGNVVLNDDEVIGDLYNVLLTNAFQNLAKTGNDYSFEIRIPDSVKQFDTVTTIRSGEPVPNEGIVIFNRTGLEDNGTCGSDKPRYADDPVRNEAMRNEARINNPLGRDPFRSRIFTERLSEVSEPAGDVEECDQQFDDLPVAAALCKVGIDDVSFGSAASANPDSNFPDLELDFVNGYINLNTNLLLSINPAAFQELTTELQ